MMTRTLNTISHTLCLLMIAAILGTYAYAESVKGQYEISATVQDPPASTDDCTKNPNGPGCDVLIDASTGEPVAVEDLNKVEPAAGDKK